MIRRRTATCAILALVMMLVGRTAAAADSRPVDVERSTLTVYAYKSGLFSAFADNHVIRAPIAGGRVSEEGTLTVELAVNAVQLTVLDPTLAVDKRAEVQARMRGPEVLDSARYPDLRFASTGIVPAGASQWHVSGDLTLHGVSRPLTFTVTQQPQHGTLSISICFLKQRVLAQ